LGNGTRVRSTSAYPRARYMRKRVSVAVISKRRNAAANPACLHASRIAVAIPRRPLRVHKKSANLPSVHGRIEQLILAVGPAFAAVECFPLAPSAAAAEQRFPGALDRLSDVTGSVGNQAPVDALRSLERSFDLVTGIGDSSRRTECAISSRSDAASSIRASLTVNGGLAPAMLYRLTSRQPGERTRALVSARGAP